VSPGKRDFGKVAIAKKISHLSDNGLKSCAASWNFIRVATLKSIRKRQNQSFGQRELAVDNHRESIFVGSIGPMVEGAARPGGTCAGLFF